MYVCVCTHMRACVYENKKHYLLKIDELIDMETGYKLAAFLEHLIKMNTAVLLRETDT